MNLPPRLAVLVIFSTVLAVAIAQNAIKCKYDGSYAEDPCKRISELSSNGDNYLDTLVPIATKNADDSYTVKGFGVVVAEDYILTAISTKFRHYGNEDLYIIFNKNVYPLKAPKVYPDIFIGKYNLKAWQDLSLVKLHPASNLKFTKFMKINGNTGIAADIMQSRKKVLSFSNDKLQIAQPVLQRPDECETMFARDVLHFDPAYMTCSNEANEKDKDFLRGAPIAYFADRNELVLFGIHSLDSLNGPGYLITYTAPHCGWLSSVSNGVVTCVSTSILTGSTSTLEAEKATTTAKKETTTKATTTAKEETTTKAASTTVKVPDTTTTQPPTQLPRAKREVCRTQDCIIGAAFYHANINEAVNPCDDFYEFTCGNFHLHHDIPADKAEYGTSSYANRRVEKQIQQSLSKPTTPSEKPYETLSKQLFQKCMDEKKVDETGLAALNKFLSQFDGGVPFLGRTGFTGSWESFFAKSFKFSLIETPLSVSLNSYPDDSSKYLLQFSQLNLFQLKDYTKYAEGMNSDFLQKALKMMIKVAKKLGATEQAAQKDMKDVLELEMKLANAAVDRYEAADPTNLKILTFGELKNKYKNKINFQDIADNLIKDYGPIDDNTKVAISCEAYFDKLHDILSTADKKVIANMVIFAFLKNSAEDLHKDVRGLFKEFDFYQQGFTNNPQTDRLSRCVKTNTDYMGLATSRLYINDHYDQAKVKPKMEELTNYVRNYFIEELKTSTWLDENTRKEALDKANALQKVIGYPDTLFDDTYMDAKHRDYEPTTDAESLVELLYRISIVEANNEFRKIFNPVHEEKETFAVSELNAVYAPYRNAMYYYAAMLQYPYLLTDAPSYVRFGTFGTVIGHELQHGYDSTGRYYDARGNLRDWWTPETLKKFEDKTQCFIDQYNGFGIDGQYSVGENAADNAGMKTAFGAYKKWVADHPDVVEPILPGFTNYTPEQMFFISWANNWCSIVDMEKARLIIDTHPPNVIRFKGITQNTDAFHDVFNCPAKTGQKCEIW